MQMASAERVPASWALWPIDKLIIAYSGIMICLLAIASRHDPRALLLIVGHIVAVGVIFLLARNKSGFMLFLRHWYLLIYLPFLYKQIPYLVSTLGLRIADSTLAHWDMMMWKIDPVFWLSSVQHRPLVEFLQVVYTMFIPGVLALTTILWVRKSRQEFRYCAFLIAATFLISYLGYLFLPARG
ncbi:MAG: hypothetical protein WA738_17635, partial [Candidatus Angelobacter sp.]